MDTNQIGKLNELNTLSYIIKKGYSVSIPFGDKDRYDQIWDIKGKLYRIQVKTGRWIDDEHSGFVFNCKSVSNGKIHKYTKDEIDYFAVYFEDQLYVIPVEECSSEKKLRFFSKISLSSINWAKDYTFEKIMEK